LALTAHPACRLAAGIVLGWCVAAPVHSATPEDARRAYEAGRFTDARGIWAELSRQGNAEAAFGIGLLYDLGNGTPENPQAAFFWYNIAARAGLPAAEFNIGALYDSGRGVAKDTADAALWYAKAAARGHHRAQFDLGQLYEQGDGVPKNPDAAAAWYRDAEQGGITAAGPRLKLLQPTRPAGPLVAAIPAFPTKNMTETLTSRNPAVELVWIAPAEPRPVHYEVWVGALGGDLRTVFTTTATETAVLAKLPETAGFYVWHADAVDETGSRAPGEWSWFSVGPSTPAQQSMAAGAETRQPAR